MTPTRFANQLIDRFSPYVLYDYRGDEQPIYGYQLACAMIAIDEIIASLTSPGLKPYFTIDGDKCSRIFYDLVKNEIEALMKLNPLP